MRCIMLMFDSLNRLSLSPYNAQSKVHTPNFQRLAERSVRFEKSYVCSMPCMPARRDLHTGRPNFLHCPWGPVEPYDDSVPQMLREAGIYTHLCTDHYHYFEDGGATYHGRYSSWEGFRGQEGDLCTGQVAAPEIPPNINGHGYPSDWVNRMYQTRDADLPQTQTVDAGLRFIDRNAGEQDWFLQLECFDPHEPFFSHEDWLKQYPTDYDGPLFDWPGSGPVKETAAECDELRRRYAALVTKCDDSLGRLMDTMDAHNMWEDTMLIVWTDHGFLLGEHGGWGKNWPPLYEEIAHTPFFVWDPRAPESAGQRRSSLVQPSIDLGPTLLRFYGQEPTVDMLGHDLSGVISEDEAVRDAAIFGYHGNRVNITDGRYIYYRTSRTRDNQPVYTYTLLPTARIGFKSGLEEATSAPPFAFSKGMPLMKIPAKVELSQPASGPVGDLLYDLDADAR